MARDPNNPLYLAESQREKNLKTVYGSRSQAVNPRRQEKKKRKPVHHDGEIPFLPRRKRRKK